MYTGADASYRLDKSENWDHGINVDMTWPWHSVKHC